MYEPVTRRFPVKSSRLVIRPLPFPPPFFDPLPLATGNARGGGVEPTVILVSLKFHVDDDDDDDNNAVMMMMMQGCVRFHYFEILLWLR